MKLSTQQESAVTAIQRWYRSGQSRVFRLFGYAGTGKTTIALRIAEAVGAENVAFAAYTGKAAHVMRRKGCAGATTIHRLMYRPRITLMRHLQEMEQELADLRKQFVGHLREKHPRIAELEEEIRQERFRANAPKFDLNEDGDINKAGLVIIDEASMVGGGLGADLLSFGIPVLVLGDPAQLPPIGDSGFFTKDRPDFLLDEIHRQAKDSPIIALATDVREGRKLPYGRYGDSAVLKKRDLTPEVALGHEQILVGRNLTRRATNLRVRSLYGMENLVTEGERVVCLRNNHDLGVLNGSQWEVETLYPGAPQEDRVLMTLSNSDDETVDVEAHTHYFEGRADELPLWDRLDAQEFDYGYALTTHKAQGSQWESVIVIDESYCFRKTARNWLYTAVTRASERVTIVRD